MTAADLQLPLNMELVRTTPEFSEETVPAGLLKAHQVAAQTWGNLVVRSGSVGFVFEDDPEDSRSVGSGQSQVIPPQRPHHLILTGPVTLVVEFWIRP